MAELGCFQNWPNLNAQTRTISVKYPDGHRELHCKQLMFHHVYEAYNLFCQMYPEDKVSLSHFRKLRPGQVVLVGAPGTHLTCKAS